MWPAGGEPPQNRKILLHVILRVESINQQGGKRQRFAINNFDLANLINLLSGQRPLRKKIIQKFSWNSVFYV